jgi:hypothetical protein
MTTKEWPFSLDLLPVQGVDSPVANIEFIKGRLVNTLTIIDGVLKTPSGLPGDLKQMIYNVRYHVIVGISLADAALRSGFSYLENASTVDGLMEAVTSHLGALRVAGPVWNAWVRSAKRDQRGFGFDGDAAIPAPIRSRFMRAAAMPISTGDYIGAGLSTAGLFQFPRRSFGADGMTNLPPDIAAGLQTAVKNDPTLTNPVPATAPPEAAALSSSATLTALIIGLGAGWFLTKPAKPASRASRRRSRRR